MPKIIPPSTPKTQPDVPISAPKTAPAEPAAVHAQTPEEPLQPPAATMTEQQRSAMEASKKRSSALGAAGVRSKLEMQASSASSPSGPAPAASTPAAAPQIGGPAGSPPSPPGPPAPQMGGPKGPPPPPSSMQGAPQTGLPTGAPPLPSLGGGPKRIPKIPDSQLQELKPPTFQGKEVDGYNVASREADRFSVRSKVIEQWKAPGGLLAGVKDQKDLKAKMDADPKLIERMTGDLKAAVAESERTTKAAPAERLWVPSPKPAAPPPLVKSPNIHIKGPQDVYVSEAVLKQSNEDLRKSKSFIELVKVEGQTEKGDGGQTLFKIAPRLRADRQVGLQGDDLAKSCAPISGRQGGEKYISWADCHRTAQTIMGSEDTFSGTRNLEHAVLAGGKTIPPISKETSLIQAADPNATDHIANRGMHAVLGHTMPLFAKKLEGIDATKYKDIIDEIKGISRTKDPKTGQEVGSYVKTYNKIYRNPELREMFSKEFGLNEFARPQVGQAFSQINNEFERKQAAELWNFHWAGVVMRDGDHYMTMENLSIEDESLSNDKWYFRMYKDEGQQSFHHLNSLDSHVGDHPMTVLFRPDNDYVPGTAQK